MCRSIQLSLSLLACAAAAPALAQTPVEAQVRPHAPSQQIRYDLATQTFERVTTGLIPLGTSAASPITTVDNTNASGFFSPIGSGDEWMDWGFSAGFLPESTVCEFTIEYATEALDLAGTGVVDLEIAFYAEPNFSSADLGDCNGLNYPGAGKGLEVARFVLTDLPGDDLPGDGFAASWQTTVDVSAIGDGFNLPGNALTSGSLGWSYRVLSDPLLTGPTLMIPDSLVCGSAADAGGTTNCFDIYSPGDGTGACNTGGPFNFVDGAGVDTGTASFFMSIEQATASSSVAVRTSGNPNEGTAVAFGLFNSGTGSAAHDGNSAGISPNPAVQVTVTPGGIGTPLLDFWTLSVSSSPGLTLPGIGTLLIGLPQFFDVYGAPGSQLELPFSLPASCNLIGATIFTQCGTIGDAGIGLTNALDFTVGNSFTEPTLKEYTFATTLSGGLEVTGIALVDTLHPGFAPGGSVSALDGVESVRFEATDGSTTEVLDSESGFSFFFSDFEFSATNFPEIESWDVSIFDVDDGLITFTTIKSPTIGGLDDWLGNDLAGVADPSNGTWTAVDPFVKDYAFEATVSNGIQITGGVEVDALHPGYSPGGTVEYQGGTEGVLSFRFEATNGSVTELIDTATIPNPTPQTIRLTFSDTNFPEVESWDFSCSNENQPPGLIQFITVQSPTNPGFEQWAGFAISGSASPSNGTWMP